ncbi:cupin domain-containing protein [Actinospica robiniae]|uniref:cupin domain-containing protein n=1 Tax=Actinospica robiniae TaxID=304901 RepID=UPI0009FBAC50|nr:cupin domain-containing protein [Actinospica robiniae]
MSSWGTDGWAIAPGEGTRVETGGPHWLEVVVRGTDVDNALGAFVFTHDVIKDNPPHAHNGFMKILYIIEGHYDFRVGDAEFSGGPGTVVVVPRGSQHTFTTPTGGRVLFVSSPAGNEEFFLELGRLGLNATPEQLADLSARFQTVGLGEQEASWREMQRSAQADG